MDRILTDKEVQELRELAKKIEKKRIEQAIESGRVPRDKWVVTDGEYERMLRLGRPTDKYIPLSKIMQKVGGRWVARKR